MRVLAAEDLALLRDGIVRLLEAHDMQVVAAVDNGPQLERDLVALRPDVSVVDVRLPPTFTDEGLRAAPAARSQYVEQLYARELLAELKERVSDVADFVDAATGWPAAAPRWTRRWSRDCSTAAPFGEESEPDAPRR